ncbi:hypothetical protein TMatcc_008124 [Talaromyces marneffei ATCC 18224]
MPVTPPGLSRAIESLRMTSSSLGGGTPRPTSLSLCTTGCEIARMESGFLYLTTLTMLTSS